MAEYIEREAACVDCIHAGVCDQSSRQVWGRMVGETECTDFKSAADVVEVVRCKDCNQWRRNAGLVDSPNGHCFYHCIDTNGNDFCSYGEKKDGKGEG